MIDGSPFHAGERAVQSRFGVRDKIEAIGRRIIRAELPKQHRLFFAQLPFVVVGVKDPSGQPWASVLAGPPGFITAPTPTRLDVGAEPTAGDPILSGLVVDMPVALLGIELHSRRRNRANGTVVGSLEGGFSVAVDQSFGNCPQYIQARQFVAAPMRATRSSVPVERKPGLDELARQSIAAADTFFIASAHPGDQTAPALGVDVSHRGGKPGFVRVDGDVLTVPDFLGNYLFNTLGNLVLEPRAGLVFPDFTTGDLLHVAADTEIVWDGPEVAAFAGAERLLRFHVREIVRVPGSLAIREVGVVEPSPFLERTGTWSSVETTQKSGWPSNTPRAFRIRQVVRESQSVKSLWLEPTDGLGAPTYKPGQYLTLNVPTPGGPLLRTYTLSGASDGRSYQISVKRQGTASAQLHAAVVGDIIDAFPPRGDFTFDETSNRPAVLLSAGIGVTPMIAMLNDLLINDSRSRHPNRLWFIHGARDGAEHPFADLVAAMAARHANLVTHTAYSSPRDDDRLGVHYQSNGRVDMALLKRILPFDDFDFYLCGPDAFMGSLRSGLTEMGVSPGRIRTEAFGPSAPKAPARPDVGQAEAEDPDAVLVEFRKSGGLANWRPRDGSLLELAESRGLSPAYSCRAGICGECSVKLLSGAVDYAEEPLAAPGPDHVLLCCARPRPDRADGAPSSLSLDL